jgi:tripeptide aminopeptidase
MNDVAHIAQDSRVQAALAAFQARQAQQLDLIKRIQQIPAPTFAEAPRAAFVAEQMAALELADVGQDETGNVYGRFPGRLPHQSPIILSAHLDTVFPADTDLTLRQEGSLLYGPGIGDNSTGVAGLLLLADCLREFKLRPERDLWFVANVCEEGMGNLRGITAVVQRFGPKASYIIIEGGLFGHISHQAIGVSRFRLEVTGPGGHSWGSFGTPSAIHVLARLIAAIDNLDPPSQPRTTFNVGIIEGGTSVNSIAQSASGLLDLRSEDPDLLAALTESVADKVRQLNKRYHKAGLTVTMSAIGQRPAGRIPRDTPLVAATVAALRLVGMESPIFITGSTDANIPFSQGITAVVLGLTEAHNAHRLDEYIDPTRLPDGLSQLLLVTLAAAGYS